MTCYECEHSAWCPAHDGPWTATETVIGEDAWEELHRMLDEPAKVLPKLKALMERKPPWDEEDA